MRAVHLFLSLRDPRDTKWRGATHISQVAAVSHPIAKEEAMVWCFVTLSALAALLSLAALSVRSLRLHLPRLRPTQLLRGCLAACLLLAALLFAGLALLAGPWLP